MRRFSSIASTMGLLRAAVPRDALSLHSAPSAAPMPTVTPIVTSIRTAFNKTRSRHLQKGKQLRGAKVAAAAPSSSKSHVGRKPSRKHNAASQKKRSAASASPTGAKRRSSEHIIYPKSERTYIKPDKKKSALAIKRDGAFHINDEEECTEQELMFANTAQIVGIMQDCYEGPTHDDERERHFGANSAVWSPQFEDTLHDKLAGPYAPAETASRRPLRAFRVRTIDKVEIPPVEVPTDRHRRGGAFLPTEILRRIMREEPGTSISSRTVTLSCVVRENRRRKVQTQSAAVANGQSVSPLGNVRKSSSTKTAAQMQERVTAHDLDDAALVGDAAIIVEEQSNHTAEQLDAAISDERSNTSIEEAEGGGVDFPLDDRHVTSLSRPRVEKSTMLTEHPSKSDGKAAAAAAQEAARRAAATAAVTDEVDDDANEAKELALASEALEELCGLTQEEVDAFAPWKEGTVIPLSTNYVTRCERVDATMTPFAPHPFAKRVPLVQPLQTIAFPPLAGVAMYGTVLAVKVLHNSREALETAHNEHEAYLQERSSVSGKGGKASRRDNKEKRTQPPIVLDIAKDGVHPPKITIEFMNDDEHMDFGRVLFDC